LLVDPAGSVHILIDSGAHLVHLTKASGAWILEDAGPPVWQLATALDSARRVHVLSMNVAGSGADLRLTHSWQTDAGWASEPAYGAGTFDVQLSLRIDGSGRAHGAALPKSAASDATLLYLRGGAPWSSFEVAGSADLNPTRGADVRIALVGHQRELLYRDGGLSVGLYHLYRAVERPSDFAIETVPYSGGFPLGDPRAMNFAIAPSGAEYVVWASGDLLQAIRDGGVWTSSNLTTIDDAGGVYGSRRPALFIDGQGVTHTVYPGFEAGVGPVLRYTAAVGSVASPSEVVAQIPQEFDQWRKADLAIAAGPLGSVRVAWVDGGEYAATTVRSATNASGAWQSSALASPPIGTAIGSHALLIEPDGTVDIVYERLGPGGNANSSGLMFGSNRCEGVWREMVVDPTTAPGLGPNVLGSRNPEITLDAAGNPHISYRRTADRSVDYARIHAGVWTLETVAGDTDSGEHTAIAVDGDGTVSIAHHDPWAGELRLATRAPVEIEPRWDGCEPLPPASEILDGDFVFETPPGTLSFYDPSGEFDESYAKLSVHGTIEAAPNGKLFLSGSGDANGDSIADTVVTGTGKVGSRGAQIRVKRTLKVFDLYAAHPPIAKLRVTRSEAIDSASRHRVVTEAVRGKVGGVKTKLDRRFEDDAPSEAFGLRLSLAVAPQGSQQIRVSASWALRGGLPLQLVGNGRWLGSSANVELVGAPKQLGIALTGLRVWKSGGAGVQLRADRVSVRAFGQKIDADLSAAY
jgi:hypothetical protein